MTGQRGGVLSRTVCPVPTKEVSKKDGNNTMMEQTDVGSTLVKDC